MELIEFDTDEEAPSISPLAARDVRRCSCGRVQLGDQVAHGETACVPFARHAPAARAAFPAPEVTSRDPWDGQGAPGPVLKLAESAAAASWRVRVQRSRGNAPHATTGRPGAVKWRYAVILAGGQDGACAYAVYDADGGVWKSVMLWSASRPWFSLASVTDLTDYVRLRGGVDDPWFAAIRARHAAADQRKKEAPKRATGTKREGLS